jgi:hypothetical protein
MAPQREWDSPPQRPPQTFQGFESLRRALQERRPEPAPTNDYGELWSRYYKALRIIRDALGKRTLGSDQRLVDRAQRVAKALSELKSVCAQLNGLERG